MSETRRTVRCAIYTRKSSDEGLEQDFNSLDSQFEACSAYIASQKHEGWKLSSVRYDDGGFSGGTLDRPALTRLLADIDAGKIDMVVVYKIDRLSRSLLDFTKLVERLDVANCSFVSVTQSFNTSTSMGRLMLNVLLSFAQFEREVTAERIRDKIAASKKKGIWMGGIPPLGYRAKDRQLVVNDAEASVVRKVFDLHFEHRCLAATKQAADQLGLRSRPTPAHPDGSNFTRGGIYWLLTNPIYVGLIRHKSRAYPGQHAPIIAKAVWDKTQALLISSPTGRRRGRKNAAYPSPLAGKIIDETSDPLVPTHAGPTSRRRRYYISRRLVERDRDQEPHGWRLPADHFEQRVATILLARLTGPGHASVLARTDARTMERADQRLRELSQSEDRSKLLALVSRIRIAPGALRVDLDPDELSRAIQTSPEALNQDRLQLSETFQLRRSGVEMRLMFGDDPQLIDLPLLRYVAKAQAWWKAVRDGTPISTLARSEGVSKRLIQMHLPAAFLAPTLIEQIIDGRQLPGLTVAALRSGDIPQFWEEQITRFHRSKLACPFAAD